MVDAIPRKSHLCGPNDNTNASVCTAINERTMSCSHPVRIEHISNICIKSDTRSQFIWNECREVHTTTDIALPSDTPSHQEQNHAPDRAGCSLKTIVNPILVRSRMPPKLIFHVIMYDCDSLQVLFMVRYQFVIFFLFIFWEFIGEV
jgi:hypothetical protein